MTALWPFCPRPTVLEALEWKTDIVSAYAAEQRTALSYMPRQSFQYDHAFTFRQLERAQLLMEANAHLAWFLPIWPERQRITLASGAVAIPIDTTTSDYRAGDMVLLWQTDEACETCEIDTVNPDSLDLVGVTSRSYAHGFVTPVRTAYCDDGLKAERTVQRIVSGACSWRVYDSIDLADSGLYGTYRSHPVASIAPRIGEASFDIDIMRDVDVVDNELAVPYRDTLSSRHTRKLAMGWMPSNAADLWALRTFLHALRGRQKGFWLPTWNRGIELAAPVSPLDTTITIRAIGLNGVAEAGDLMIKTRAGTQTYLQHTAVAPSGDNEVLTLSGPAGISIQPDDVHTLCRMHFCRAEQDRVELQHQHTGRGQITSVLLHAVEVPVP